jgi:hypothetical protein
MAPRAAWQASSFRRRLSHRDGANGVGCTPGINKHHGLEARAGFVVVIILQFGASRVAVVERSDTTVW